MPRQPDAVEQRERTHVAVGDPAWALRALLRANAELEQQMPQRLGLSPLEYAALTQVMGAPEPLGPAAVARRLGISTGSGTELVHRLETAGHLHRIPGADAAGDRRRIHLQATPMAIAAVVAHLSPLLDGIDAIAAQLSPTDAQIVTHYLNSATHALRAFSGDHVPTTHTRS